MSMTTVKSGFRVEDITFRNARRQSAIELEIEKEQPTPLDIEAPVSLTPEQVKSFYTAKSKDNISLQEKRVYLQTIVWIDELLEVKKKLIALETKEEVRLKVERDNEDDIVEEGV